MAFRSVVSCRPFISALVFASAASLVGCGDDGSSPPADGPDSGADAAVTTATAKPTGTVKPTATPTGTQAPTAKPTGTPVDTDAGPDAEVPNEPDAATSASPDTGPLTPETGPAADGGPVVTPDAAPGDGAVLPPVDGGPTDGGATDGGGAACFDNTSQSDPNVYPNEVCDTNFATPCVDGGEPSPLFGKCMSFFPEYSKGVFDTALACFLENSELCASDAEAQFDACLASASAQACPLTESGCDTFAAACSEITVGDCNARVSAFSSFWLDLVSKPEADQGLGCFDLAGDVGCRDLFMMCTDAYPE